MTPRAWYAVGAIAGGLVCAAFLRCATAPLPGGYTGVCPTLSCATELVR